MPKNFAPLLDGHGFDLHALVRPAREVGGDFYTFFFVDDESFLFAIGDVAGKGVPAALLMSRTVTLIRTLALERLATDEILRKANEELCIDNDSCMFVTVFCALFNTRTGSMTYTNGGHNPPAVIPKEGAPGLLDGARCTCLGLEQDALFEKSCMILQPDESVCLYTDGVTEALNSAGELFSTKRLLELLEKQRSLPAKEMAGKVFSEVEAHACGAEQSDDITVLILQKRWTDSLTVPPGP
ncbi:MAG: PP2C family protein-serine/threonine phosphatase [Candidatus Eremiobacteraeota bacterium]|nr:PP2C family protein-serine/threonine phosphatase [Candidatus Eremiobacteraeota bacterium]